MFERLIDCLVDGICMVAILMISIFGTLAMWIR